MIEARPIRIAMTSAGVAESWLLRELGLTTLMVYPLHGDVIGAPRDYVYCRHGRHGHAPGYYYTAEGVRALAHHFGLQVEVQTDAVAPVAAPAPTPRYWWQKDNQ